MNMISRKNLPNEKSGSTPYGAYQTQPSPIQILMVDDRRENLLALEAVLADTGYELISFTSGEQALKYLFSADRENLAVILMDVQMPGIDGYETARLIRSRSSLRNIPILFITAQYKSPQQVRMGYESGSIDYIFKPFDSEILRLKVEAFVNLHRYQKELYRTNVLLKERTQELEQANLRLVAAEAQLTQHRNNLELKVEERTYELTLLQRRFQTIFSMSPNLMAMKRARDNHYMEVNAEWVKQTGYTLMDMRKYGESLLEFRISGETESARLGNESYRNLRITYLTGAKEERVGLLSSEKVQIGTDLCILLVITDITEKQEWETQLARLERLHLIGEMAAGIAHEVRNPMTTIRGFLQLCKQNPQTSIQNYIDIMLQELSRANYIITEFLTLSKNKTNQLESQSLFPIMESIQPLIEAEAMLNGKSAVFSFQQVPDLLLDGKEIRQLILNLAINGLEAMESGGSLSVRIGPVANGVSLEVEDMGSGIPEAILEKLGTPFFTTKETGTGLGLAVCYSIAERHKARISIKSDPSGTTFTVVFPLQAGSEA